MTHSATPLLHKLKRLGDMGTAEIAYRVRERGRAEMERVGVLRNDASFQCPAGASVKEYLATACAPRFFPGVARETSEFVTRRFPDWVERAVDEADRLCRHQLNLFAFGSVDLGKHINWHKDPITGHVWERRFWNDYQLEREGTASDPKNIHELNRHGHLPRLAKAFHFTGDERYASEALAQMLSWIDQNPPGVGISWHSSLEIAIRVIGWLWTIFWILPSSKCDEQTISRVLGSLLAQLDHVSRYPSRFSSPNTHLLGEATALFLGGLTFRDHHHGAAWLSQGAAILADQRDKQILEDGVYGELSSYYHCYALDFYLQALILAKHNRHDLAPRLRPAVRAMLRFLAHLTRPDGEIPLLGDDDGGRALSLNSTSYRSYRDGLAIGSILFERGDFKFLAEEYCEEALWFLGVRSWEEFQTLESQPPAETASLFPAAGYFIERSGWSRSDSHVIFDLGGLGMGNGAHAHADSLSITLYGNGRDLLIDPGTCIYNGAPQLREYFRSTRSHNTVTIDECDQAVPGGTFRWNTRIVSHQTIQTRQPLLYVEGCHEGYRRLSEPVTHRRRLVTVGQEYWLVLDDFVGRGRHIFDLHFHLPSEETGLVIGIFGSQPLETSTCVESWMSKGYGHKTQSKTLRARIAAEPPASAMTVLSVGEGIPRLQQFPVQDGVACVCMYPAYRDVVIAPHRHEELSVDGFLVCGDFFWIRMDGDTILDAACFGASQFSYEGTSLMESNLCAESAAF